MASTDTPRGRGATTPGRNVDAGTLNTLNESYHLLVKAGEDSVRAAWRFGQCIDSFSEAYYMYELADSMDLSVGTLYRYTRLYHAYQRPELAVDAARQLETYNIDLIWRLHNDLHPVPHGRSLRGRHWRNTCKNCGHHEIRREEVDKQGNLLVTDEQLAEMVNGPAVPEVQFNSGALGSHGIASHANARHGSAWRGRLGLSGRGGLGQAGRGLAAPGRIGVAGPGEGKAWVARQGSAGRAWHVKAELGMARQGPAGGARQGAQGLAARGPARQGTAVRVRHSSAWLGRAGRVRAQCGSAGRG